MPDSSEALQRIAQALEMASHANHRDYDLMEIEICAGRAISALAALDAEVQAAEDALAEAESGKHICCVDDDPDGGQEAHYRACPASLCEADLLLNVCLGLTEELEQRRVCLVAARDDFARILGAGVEDGGLWIRAVAEGRIPMVEGAIAETDSALARAALARSTAREATTHGRGCPCTPCSREDWDAIDAGLRAAREADA